MLFCVIGESGFIGRPGAPGEDVFGMYTSRCARRGCVWYVYVPVRPGRMCLVCIQGVYNISGVYHHSLHIIISSFIGRPGAPGEDVFGMYTGGVQQQWGLPSIITYY